jgi:flagellin-like protein
MDGRHLNERAVSPVIGVMLMIVVTVILAAAVTAFSGSMQQKDNPTTAMFDISCSKSDGIMTFKHMGGDIIYKEDIKIEVSHGIPKMTSYLPKENLTFYPAEQVTDDINKESERVATDKTALEPGQIAIYRLSWANQSDSSWTVNGTTYSLAGNPALGEQVVLVGETFHLSIIDINTENTIYATDVVMEP